MNKLTKKVVYLFALISCLSGFVFAEEMPQNVVVSSNTNSLEPMNGYIINDYNIDMKVNENNTFDITEKIGTTFTREKHGIFRNIPLYNNVQRVDGTNNRNRVKITDIKVNSPYSTTVEDGNKVIKIGSEDVVLTGKQNYEIKYTYNIGKDPVKEADELYFNIIGPEWDTNMENITFTVTMPKEFDASKLGFSTGRVGVQGTTNVDYKVEGNVIKGKVLKGLTAGEALTIRLELPEGYFVNAGHKFGFLDFIYLAVPILSALLAAYLWNKYGKDDQVVETVEFYPPEKLNSLELGCMYRGEVNNKDITSLLIYLANKGYIKIVEKDKVLLTTPFEIIKLKDYDGNNEFERIFLEGLYKEGHTVDGKIVIKDTDLQNNFYKTIQKINTKANNYISKKGIFETNTFGKTALIALMTVISLGLVIGIPTLQYGALEGLGELIGVIVVILVSLLPLISSKNKASSIAMSIITFAIIGFVLFSLDVTDAMFSENYYKIGTFTGAASIIGMVVAICYMPKRTKYGNEILGKIRGFKTFLETAEKDKLEAMVLENPKYFYDILPFTYVLGVSDKWIKKFESINMEEPDWYESTRPYRISNMNSFVNSTMATAENVMASSPSTNGGGSYTSSGGGFSGGGSGGGGGGSW